MWRQGRKVPIHVYQQRGPLPDDADRPLGTFLRAADAELACIAVNDRIALLALQGRVRTALTLISDLKRDARVEECDGLRRVQRALTGGR